MTRSRLHNAFLQNTHQEHKNLFAKQRNFFVSLLRKTKKNYYGNLNNLNLKCVSHNKLFWKIVKRFLSDKVMCKDRLHLTESNAIVKTDLKTVEIFLTIIFFNNAVQNPEISTYETNNDLVIDNNKDPTLKAVLNKCITQA